MSKRCKGDPSKVDPYMAELALRRTGGDRKRAYSECIRLSWQTTGRFAPGFDNADLQAYYDETNIKKSPRIREEAGGRDNGHVRTFNS